ncbi:MAG TPA: hypothetical protein VHP99_18160, partial [Pyrinomonadaceae bacterium]|nr:hypothetical protein [Pyrinomonadaceae bacterium]
RLWPDTFVEESNLTQNIFTLRKALNESSSYIETVPRRGYRFAGEIRGGTSAGTEELIVTTRTRTQITSEEETIDEPAQMPPSHAGDLAVGRNARAVARAPLHIRARDVSISSSLSRRIVVSLAVIGTVAVFVTGGFVLNRVMRSRGSSGSQAAASRTSDGLQLKRLTYDSKAYDPALSPDGTFVAYMFRDGEHESIRLRNIANGSTVEVLPPATEEYANLAFSPDGNYLYFTTRANIERAPLFGGTPPQVMAKEVWSSFGLSPDGRRLAFFRGYGSGQDIRLIVTDINAGGEQELIRSRGFDLWFAIWGSGPAWSPDGKKIAVVAGQRSADGDHDFLLEVHPDDASSTQIPGARWRSASQQAWLPDGSGLVVSARERAGAPYQLWLVAYPAGEVRRLTNDLNDYDKISISRDGRQLVAEQETGVSHVWVLPDGDTRRARQLTSGAADTDGRNGVAWTPDKRLLFTSLRGGANDIWEMKSDGTEARALTSDTGGANWEPRTTPDGRYVVFASTRGGKESIWRMDADGSNVQRLTAGGCELDPYISPDGKWVYYTNAFSSPAVLEKTSIEGGEPQKMPNEANAASPIISPDGNLIAYEYYDEQHGWHTAVLPVDGGAPRLMDFHAFHGAVRWMPDSRSLVYVEAKRPENLWLQPLAGGPPRRLTSFVSENISCFDLSANGKDIVLARGNVFSDVVLITNFR